MTSISAYRIVPEIRTSTGAVKPAVAAKGAETGLLDEGYLAVDTETGDRTFTFRIGEDNYQLDIRQGKSTLTKNGQECPVPNPGAAGLMLFTVGACTFTMLFPDNSNPGFLQVRDKTSGRQSDYEMVENTNSGNTAFVRKQRDAQKLAEQLVPLRLTNTATPGVVSAEFQGDASRSSESYNSGGTDPAEASTDSNATTGFRCSFSWNLGSASTTIRIQRQLANTLAKLSAQIEKNATVLSNPDSTPQQKAEAQKAMDVLSKTIRELLQPFLQGSTGYSTPSLGTGNTGSAESAKRQ